MILKIIIVIALLIIFLIMCHLADAKKKNKSQNDMEDESDILSGVVIGELVNTNSKLFKFVKTTALMTIDEAIMNGSGYDYNFFKAYLMESIAKEAKYSIEEYGLESIYDSNESSTPINQSNLIITISAIMDMPEIDSVIAKIFVDKITSNISDAESHEKDAIEMHKEYDQAPGKDEELHPRIPNPEVAENIDSDEMSIEALSSTGTVEDVN